MQWKRSSSSSSLIPLHLVAPIELKTRRAKLNPVQLVLELVAASRMSKYGQGVVVLGTDLQVPTGKWYVAFFPKQNRIYVNDYTSPDVALERFSELVLSCKTRGEKLQTLQGIAEEDDDDGAGEEEKNIGVSLPSFSILCLFLIVSQQSTL